MLKADLYPMNRTILDRPAVSKAIRVVTVAPVMAALLVTVFRLNLPGAYSALSHYLITLLGLSVLPVMAYPIARAIPALHKKGRHGARSLAIVLSVTGYIVCMVPAFLMGGSRPEKLIALTYLMSGVLMALTNFVFHFRASGHACGVAGPIAALSLCVSPWYLCLLPLFALVVASSLKLRRHTLPQLLAGAACSVAPLLLFIRLL